MPLLTSLFTLTPGYMSTTSSIDIDTKLHTPQNPWALVGPLLSFPQIITTYRKSLPTLGTEGAFYSCMFGKGPNTCATGKKDCPAMIQAPCLGHPSQAASTHQQIIIPVYLRLSQNTYSFPVQRALFDSGTSANFIDHAVAHCLGIPSTVHTQSPCSIRTHAWKDE